MSGQERPAPGGDSEPFVSPLAAMASKDADRDKAFEWSEEEFYGRYEVTLMLDVGTVDGALEITRLIRSWLAEVDPPCLGHTLDTRYVVGSERKRKQS